MTLYAHWSRKEANPDPDTDDGYLTDEEYTLTDKDGSLVCVTVVENGKIVDITENVKLEQQDTTQIGMIPAGAMVTVAANAAPEGMVFAQWNISDPELMGDPNVAYTSQTMTFPMPAADVTISAHWRMVEANPDPDMDEGYLTDEEYTLTDKDGSLVRVTVEQNGKTVDITKNVKLEKQGTTQIGKIPAGAMVTVAANAAPEGMVFAQWNISDPELMGDPNVAYTSQTMTFPMPAADVTISAHWRMVEANPDPDMDEGYLTDEEYTLTEKDGSLVRVTVEENGATVDITKSVVLNKQGTTQIGKIPAGAMVTVEANAAPEGMVFAQWNISDPALMGDPDVAHTSQTMTFPMPAADVTVEAMYESAENARETELLGSAAMIGAVGISAVVLAYQAHQLGTELYLRYLLPSGAAIPQNRIQLAELLWRNAGEPVPDVNAMYEDIGLNDDAAQQAAQWALENELMELPDEEHTEQFKPDEQISYGEAIRAWKKAQQLKTAE